jgi:hypothetical protein
MSSYQTIRLVTVTVNATVGVSGSQALDLGTLLGPGGTRLLLETLGGLCDGNPQLERVAGAFQWQRVAGEEDQFVLPLTAGLPAAVELLTLHLSVRGSVAEVSHEARFRGSLGEVPAALSASLRSLTNQAVNRLLALTIADQLRQRVSEKIARTPSQRLENAVSMRLRNQASIQTVARIRAGGAR